MRTINHQHDRCKIYYRLADELKQAGYSDSSEIIYAVDRGDFAHLIVNSSLRRTLVCRWYWASYDSHGCYGYSLGVPVEIESNYDSCYDYLSTWSEK